MRSIDEDYWHKRLEPQQSAGLLSAEGRHSVVLSHESALEVLEKVLERYAAEPAAESSLDQPEPEPARDLWSDRARGMTCASCMWYVAKRDPGTPSPVVEVGRCRRHAPTVTGYPVVYPADWCGDHKLG